MKTRKTLKKRRTSKKYNKTQFRRFNKYNNLTRTMKGGGTASWGIECDGHKP